jgi:hypothetical protein
MPDDTANYLNSPLPGCGDPAAPTWGDFAEMLDQERYRVPAVDEESSYMLRELSLCFRKARADQEQLRRAARMLRELSQLWGRHHGPGWVLTPKAEEALSDLGPITHPSAGYYRRSGPTPIHAGWFVSCDQPECRNANAIREEAIRASSAELAADIAERPTTEPDGPTPLTDAGEGC